MDGLEFQKRTMGHTSRIPSQDFFEKKKKGGEKLGGSQRVKQGAGPQIETKKGSIGSCGAQTPLDGDKKGGWTLTVTLPLPKRIFVVKRRVGENPLPKKKKKNVEHEMGKRRCMFR